MLGLKLATDDRWVRNCVEGNYEAILSDHAWCEQKAASNAISLIVSYPELEEMVVSLTALVSEEMDHFRQVHDLIRERGFQLGRSEKDDYVGDLMLFIRKGGPREHALIDRLLFAAMIEARSCERFKLLSEQVQDTRLAEFYHSLMASEARHYTMFIRLAKKYCNPDEVEARWEEWLRYESEVVARYGRDPKMHG